MTLDDSYIMMCISMHVSHMWEQETVMKEIDGDLIDWKIYNQNECRIFEKCLRYAELENV